MRNPKKIDPSLNKKIVQNERKIQDLFNTGLNKSQSRLIILKPFTPITTNPPPQGERNIRHKKNMSQDEIYKSSYNKNNKTMNNFKSAIDSTPYSKYSQTIHVDKDEKPKDFINRMKKRIRLKSTDKKEEEKSNKIFYNTFNNVYKKLNNKSKKVYNKDQLNTIVDRLYTNDYKCKKQPFRENEKENSKIGINTIETPVKKQNENNANVNEMIERFEKDIKKRYKKIEKKREELKKNEKKIYTHKPELKKNKKYQNENKDSFLERQKKYDENKKKKEEKYIENLRKTEQEKLNIDSYIFKKHNKKREKEKDKETENEIDSKRNNKEDVEKTIKNLYEWEAQRKKKIEQKQKEKIGAAETKFDYHPKINQRSNSIVKKNKNRKIEPDVFSRLSKEDKVLKEKKQLLIDLYTPSFHPSVYVDKNGKKKKKKKMEYIDIEELKLQKKKKKKNKIKESSDSENDEEDSEDDEGSVEEDDEEDDKEEDEKEVNFDYKQNPKIFAEDNVQNKLRQALLHKIKK